MNEPRAFCAFCNKRTPHEKLPLGLRCRACNKRTYRLVKDPEAEEPEEQEE